MSISWKYIYIGGLRCRRTWHVRPRAVAGVSVFQLQALYIPDSPVLPCKHCHSRSKRLRSKLANNDAGYRLSWGDQISPESGVEGGCKGPQGPGGEINIFAALAKVHVALQPIGTSCPVIRLQLTLTPQIACALTCLPSDLRLHPELACLALLKLLLAIA